MADSDRVPPIMFRWDGEAMLPVSQRFALLCDRHFVIGRPYELVEVSDRSMRSHRHYFALVRDAWENLPESAALEPWAQTPEHLRKYALIRTGYHHSQSFPCASAAEARRFAVMLRPIDEFGLVLARGDVVERYVARSQSERAMGREAFQASKDSVLDFLADLIGVEDVEAWKRPKARAA